MGVWNSFLFRLVIVCLVTQLYPTFCNPMDGSPPGSSVHGDSPGKNTGVGCHALLQGIFPTQVSYNAGGFFTSWATTEAQLGLGVLINLLIHTTVRNSFHIK